jgi:DNA-damage-inducible protein J
MATTTLIQTRVDAGLRQEASKVLEEVGLDLTTAVRMFLKMVVQHQGIPFKVKVDPFWSEENQEWLKKAIAQADRGEFVRHELIED